MNAVIPLDLVVSLEIGKLIYTAFMHADAWMKVPDFDLGVINEFEAHTFNLHEEIAEIEYLFCDKTGTLTKNLMEFKRMSIGPNKYGTME